MTEVLRIRSVGLDTSHVVAFTGILNDSTNPHHIPDAQITVGFPGESTDFDLSPPASCRFHA